MNHLDMKTLTVEQFHEEVGRHLKQALASGGKHAALERYTVQKEYHYSSIYYPEEHHFSRNLSD